MKNKFEIFDHRADNLELFGKLGSFRVDIGSSRCVITRFPFAAFNSVSLMQLDDSIIIDLKRQNIPFVCLPSSEAIEKDFGSFMGRHGLVIGDFCVAHEFTNLDSWQYSANHNIKIQKVMNEKDLYQFDKVSSIAFRHPQGMTFDFLKSALFCSDIDLFTVSIGRKVVACGMLSLINNMAGLYWDGVLPEYRKRGIATALIEYRMNIAKNKGFDSVYVQNMNTSINCYQRIGFKAVGGLPLYVFAG